MKLLQLHIRNIASIERADIDFENEPGLIDPDSHQPARIFLIYGDTGTGKSILLDAISMALFDNTPRLKSVADIKQNKYRNSDGHELSINSIVQYTRLGITHRDECYSEVLFQGNDSLTYRARMQLGLSRENNHQKRWTLQVGQNPEISGSQCADIIRQAIGMNFDQFCRMAMLAQGQFASFLCGSRADRADILEKLTNTSLFSRYGEAIHRLFRKKEILAQKAADILEEAKRHILPEENIASLSQAVKTEKAEAEKYQKEADAVNLRLSHLSSLLRLEKSLSERRLLLQTLLEKQQSAEYVSARSLVSLWDNTEPQRILFSRLVDGRARLSSALAGEASLKASFANLLADLHARQADHRSRQETALSTAQKIELQQPLHSLFSHADAFIEKLSTLLSEQADAASLEADINRLTALRPSLLSSKEEALRQQNIAASTLAEAQKKIDSLSEKLLASNPEKIQSSIDAAELLLKAYRKLSDDLSQFLSDEQTLLSNRTLLADLEKKLLDAFSALKTADEAYLNKKTAYERTLSRFSTLSAGLDQTIENLRLHLYHTDDAFCPICGRSIEGSPLSHDYFASLLSPLEQERDEAKQSLLHAENQRTKAHSEHSNLSGQLAALSATVQKQQSALENFRSQLLLRMEKANISPDSSASSLLADRISSLEQQTESLRQQRTQADQLKNELNSARTEHTRLLQEKTVVDLALQKATSAISTNEDHIRISSERLSELQRKATDAKASLNEQLSSWYPTWAEDIPLAQNKLRQDSEAYASLLESFRAEQESLRSEESLLSHIDTLRQSILSAHPSWSEERAPLSSPLSSPVDQWTTLSHSTVANDRAISDATATIDTCLAELSPWFASNGATESTLASLSLRGEDVKKARTLIAETDNSIAQYQQNIADLEADLGKERLALDLSPTAAPPQQAALEEELSAAIVRRDKALSSAASAESLLLTDAEHRQHYTDALSSFEAANKEKNHWSLLDARFGADRFRNLVQTYILRPLLANANIYLQQINPRYSLTCSEENEKLSILVLDSYNRNEVRSTAVLSGGERFMISLALSLALSSLGRNDISVDILFIDEGFGTLDQASLDSVLKTLRRLSEMAGQTNRRVGIISHREELLDAIPNKIRLRRCGEGRSTVEISCD